MMMCLQFVSIILQFDKMIFLLQRIDKKNVCRQKVGEEEEIVVGRNNHMHYLISQN
jgi:hypothetical protein